MNANRFEGSVAFVTGGASGIGAATARLLASEGAAVAVADRNTELAQAVAESLGRDGARALAVSLDVTSEPSWDEAVGRCEAELGAPRILINSAGISVPANVEDASFEHWQETMAINATGVFLGCKHGVRSIKRQGGGAIVNIASTMAARPGAAYVAYAASKAAVVAITRSTAMHCAQQGYGIRCNAVLPGATHTPMVDTYLDNAPDADALLAQFTSVHPLGRIGQAEDIAAGIAYLASSAADWVTGVSLPIDGGYLAA